MYQNQIIRLERSKAVHDALPNSEKNTLEVVAYVASRELELGKLSASVAQSRS